MSIWQSSFLLITVLRCATSPAWVLTVDEQYKTESHRTVHSAGESAECWHRQKIMMLFMSSPDRKWPVIHHPPVNIMTRAFSLHSLFMLHKNITRLQTTERSACAPPPPAPNGCWSIVSYCMAGPGHGHNGGRKKKPRVCLHSHMFHWRHQTQSTGSGLMSVCWDKLNRLVWIINALLTHGERYNTLGLMGRLQH